VNGPKREDATKIGQISQGAPIRLVSEGLLGSIVREDNYHTYVRWRTVRFMSKPAK
jgi:hypothetical protein